MKRVVIPLPAQDFDPSEAAISWRILRDAGHEVVFATPEGRPAQADPVMLSGEGLDPWGRIPGLRRLKLFGLALRADLRGRAAHTAMTADPAFRTPLRWSDLKAADFDALLLPGGHAQGMRPYLESTLLQAFVADCFDRGTLTGRSMPVAAICHGVLLAARAVSPRTGRSVLHGRKTTALTWSLERSAWNLTRYWGRFWDRNYYRTYVERGSEPAGYWSVEHEVKRWLAQPSDFVDVPPDAPDAWRKRSGLFRDHCQDARPAWVVRDGLYLSARWPGDAHTFARQFVQMLEPV